MHLKRFPQSEGLELSGIIEDNFQTLKKYFCQLNTNALWFVYHLKKKCCNQPSLLNKLFTSRKQNFHNYSYNLMTLKKTVSVKIWKGYVLFTVISFHHMMQNRATRGYYNFGGFKNVIQISNSH